MATFKLRAGHHYHAVPPLSSLPWVGARRIERLVCFDASCAYESAPYNGQDVNKLFGLSFGLRGVHYDSARFGWRYSQADQCIELLAYVYNQGTRNWDEQLRFPVVAQVQPGEELLCCLNYHYDTGYYSFTAWLGEREKNLGTVLVAGPSSLPSFGLTHGLYFGGALACPHAMRVRIDRV